MPGIRIEAPVRWGDMDAFGHVNNTKYFQYCESARIAYFEALRLNEFRAEPAHGPGLVAAQLNFRRQVRYPATLDVFANSTRLGRSSWTLAYRLQARSDGAVVADGTSVIVWVDYSKDRAIPLPAALAEAIAALEETVIASLRG